MFRQENKSEDDPAELKHEIPISEFYTSVNYGFLLENKHQHDKTNADIMTVVYNSRLRGFVILDTRGIVTCKLNRTGMKVERVLLYPKYEHRVITLLQYVKKYNCYFVLDKDFIVKVLNKDFEEVYSMDSETIGASFMIFNSVTDELFTGGVGGTKIWQFHKISEEMFNEIKHLSNYKLTRKTTLPKVGGSWVQKIQVNPVMKHLYCSSDMSVHVYNMTGKLLYYFEQIHTMKITGCCYCHNARVFATSSWDTTVKIWGLNGSLLHTFRGHSKPISNLILHPKNPLLLVSSSFDGTIKIWCLETLDQIYSLAVYASDGPMWMFLTEENMICVFNPQQISLWSLNHFINFWNLTRCQIFHMCLQSAGRQKSTRLIAVGIDSSLRLFSRKNGRKLCTVLPPPCLSPLEKLLDFCYSRQLNLVYLLLNPNTIWIYTSRTDPACRLTKWNTGYLKKKGKISNSINRFSVDSDFAVECWVGDACQCRAICFLASPIVMTTDAGQSCPDCQEFLLLGLEDGWILFMDPIIKGLKYLEFKASKDAITALYYDKLTDSLVTKSKLSDQNLIQIWGLPYLDLQFNISCALNLTTWTRLGATLLTGYEDGYLFWHTLIKAEDYGPLNPKMYPEFDSHLKPGRAPPHQAEILNVDACPARLLLSSCSSDGNIKIWEKSGTLIREIILDNSLGSICFLNDLGDLLVSFQNHIFCIPHSKVCPHSLLEKSTNSTSSANESDIYEDPSITTEGLIMHKEEYEGMKSYLVPYQMDFSKYFSPGKLSQMTAEISECEKDLRKEENLIEKIGPLEENLEAASTEIYLSPREPLSESWSSTSFLSHTERLDSDYFKELHYPKLNSSPDQNCLSELSGTNSLIEDILKDQDSVVLQKEFIPLCTEISEVTNLPKDSERHYVTDASPESMSLVVNHTISMESQQCLEKDILSDFFAARLPLHDEKMKSSQLFNEIEESGKITRPTSQEFPILQKIKRPPVRTKKKKRKKFVAQHKKCLNKQKKKCKEDHHDNIDYYKDVVLKKNNQEVVSLQKPEEYTSNKNSSADDEIVNKEHSVSASDKLQDTQAVDSLQISNDCSRYRKHPQIIEKKENERPTHIRRENQQQIDTENELDAGNANTKMPQFKIVIKTKDDNYFVPGEKELCDDSKENIEDNFREESDESPELKYLPMTIKITPHQSGQQENKERKSFPQSKSNQTKYKHIQDHQKDFNIQLDEFATKFSQEKTKASSLLHGRDENDFGKDWYQKKIERHHLQQLQKSLRQMNAERQHQIYKEKNDHGREYNEVHPKIMATLPAGHRKVIYVPGSKFSNNEKIYPSTFFPKSENSFQYRRGPHVENFRRKSASVLTNATKIVNMCYSDKANFSSAPSNTPIYLSDQQYSPKSEIPEDGTLCLQEEIFEKQENDSNNYRFCLPKSQVQSPQRPKTGSSQLSHNTRKYELDKKSFRHTKSIPEKSGPCKMVVFGDSMVPKYRFPTPLEVRLLTKRFPQMCTRILYHHYTQSHLPNRKITSAPAGRYFSTHSP